MNKVSELLDKLDWTKAAEPLAELLKEEDIFVTGAIVLVTSINIDGVEGVTLMSSDGMSSTSKLGTLTFAQDRELQGWYE